MEAAIAEIDDDAAHVRVRKLHDNQREALMPINTPIDPSKSIEVTYVSRGMMPVFLRIFVSVAAVTAFIFLWLDLPLGQTLLASFAGALLFTSLAVYSHMRDTRRGVPVITLTPSGILDTRLCSDEIPWLAVAKIDTWSNGKECTLILSVDPEVEAKLALTPVARFTRRGSAKRGADGLSISTTGTSIDHDELLAASNAYAQAARANFTP